MRRGEALVESPDRGCANEGCARAAEPGERWCSTCGLDRAMFRRDARRAAAESRGGAPGGEADRR